VRLTVALERDRAGFGQRCGRLLALATLGALDHDELRTTQVNPGTSVACVAPLRFLQRAREDSNL
jgi:hypothetical protein